MRDLSLVGLSEDRRYVVFRSHSGEEFRVPADDRLAAALRGDRARLGQLEIQMDSALRPRDIQARIRRGESADAVAEAAQVPVEKIMAYAVPVLAEREHVCDRARTSTIRRGKVSGQSAVFGDVMNDTLRRRDIDATTVTWDSWRRADGRWVVAVDVPGETGQALYLFDAPGRYVVADNDLARNLVGDNADDDTDELAIATAIAAEPDVATEPAIAAEPEFAPVPPVDDDIDEPGVTSLRRARARRALAQEQLLLEGEGPSTPAQDDGEEQEPEPQPDTTSVASEEQTDDLSDAAAQVRAAADEAPTQVRASGDDTGGPPPSEHSPAASQKRSRRRERRRVPSWDEIMFGDKPDE